MLADENKNRWWLVKLFISFWVIYIFHFNPSPPGGDRHVYLTRAIVEHGTLQVDASRAMNPDFFAKDTVFHQGHFYSITNPGMPFLATPGYFVVHALYDGIVRSPEFHTPAIESMVAQFSCVAFCFAPLSALAGVLIAAFVFVRTQSISRSFIAACLYALGSIAFFFSTKTIQNPVNATMIIIIFVLAFEPGIGLVFQGRVRLAAIGFVSGLAILIDLPAIPLLLIMTPAILKLLRGWRDWLAILIAGAVPVAILMVYQYAAFGNPFFPAQKYMSAYPDNAFRRGFLGLSTPDPIYIIQMLFSPRVGLFLYMPFTVAAMWYLVRHIKRTRPLSRLEFNTAIALVIGHILFISTNHYIQDSFGPRYLLPIIPVLAIAVGLYAPNTKGFGYWCLAMLFFLSLLINLAGTQLGLFTNNPAISLMAWLIRGPWLPAFDWLKDNIAALGFHPTTFNPINVLLVLLALLAIIWHQEFLHAVGIARQAIKNKNTDESSINDKDSRSRIF